MHAPRVRPLTYFAMGVAVTAVAAWSLSAWQASAEVGADESTFVAVSPTRILDTREDIGLAGPFVSATPQDLQVTGTIATKSGTGVVVPDGATGVVLNVTAVQPTADGFVSIRPADAPGVPTTSSLNFAAGDIIPNSVTVQMPTSGGDAGKIEITYDAFGNAGPTTEMLVDVVGYTKNAGLASLQAQVNQLQTRIDQFSQVDVSDVVFDGDPAGGALAGTYPSPSLANLSVSSGNIVDGSVTSAKVADNTLTAADLAANSVATGELAADAVTSAKVLDGSLTPADLQPNSIGPGQLTDDAFGLTAMNAVVGNDLPVDSNMPLGAGECHVDIDVTLTGAPVNSRMLVLRSHLQGDPNVSMEWLAFGGNTTTDPNIVHITICNHTGVASPNPPAMTVSFIAIGE